MGNLLIKIAYNGTAYHGFQVQTNAVTVCKVFQDAVEKVFGERIDIKPCSRTDTGVHANEFCLSMKTDSSIPCAGIVTALNAHLPGDIAVLSCSEVPSDFHARYSAKGKRYIYKVYNAPIRSPFYTNTAYHLWYNVNWELVEKAAADFVGTHDFTTFCATGSKITDKVRTVYSFKVYKEGDLVVLSVEGDGFLYNMVRIMVGTLLDIGQGRLPRDCIPEVLASKERARARRTAPPQGLYLDKVFY